MRTQNAFPEHFFFSFRFKVYKRDTIKLSLTKSTSAEVTCSSFTFLESKSKGRGQKIFGLLHLVPPFVELHPPLTSPETTPSSRWQIKGRPRGEIKNAGLSLGFWS